MKQGPFANGFFDDRRFDDAYSTTVFPTTSFSDDEFLQRQSFRQCLSDDGDYSMTVFLTTVFPTTVVPTTGTIGRPFFRRRGPFDDGFSDDEFFRRRFFPMTANFFE